MNTRIKDVRNLFLTVVFISSLAVCASASDQSVRKFDHKEGLIAYFSVTGEKVRDNFFPAYVETHYPDVFLNRSNEFIWQDGLTRARREFNESVQNFNLGQAYYATFPDEVETYDFVRQGFTLRYLSRTKNPFIIFDPDVSGLPSQSGYASEPNKMRRVVLWLDNAQQLKFMPYSEKASRKFLDDRTSQDSFIDRNVQLVIHFRVLPVKNEYRRMKTLFTSTGEAYKAYKNDYVVMGKIDFVEVYEDEELKHKMAELVGVEKIKARMTAY